MSEAATKADAELAGLRSLLDEHQELGRLQGNRMDAITSELGKTHAKLRAAQQEIGRLNTMLSGYTRKTTP
jgi:hypothetical protein